MMNILERWNAQEHGPRDAPAVVFLHGFMGRGEDWRPVIGGLADAYRCITLDLPGHGRHAVSSETTQAEVLRDVRALGDALGLEQAGLVGYSMGGRLALWWALNAPQHFAGVVAESAQPGIHDDAAREERRTQDTKICERLRGMVDDPAAFREFVAGWYRLPLFESVQRRTDLLGQLIYSRANNDPAQLALATGLIGTGVLPPVWDSLARNAIPMLCVVGEADRKYRAIAEEMSGLCPKVAVQTLADCGHNVHLEKPGEYTTVLRSFLDAALRPGA